MGESVRRFCLMFCYGCVVYNAFLCSKNKNAIHNFKHVKNVFFSWLKRIPVRCFFQDMFYTFHEGAVLAPVPNRVINCVSDPNKFSCGSRYGSKIPKMFIWIRIRIQTPNFLFGSRKKYLTKMEKLTALNGNDNNGNKQE